MSFPVPNIIQILTHHLSENSKQHSVYNIFHNNPRKREASKRGILLTSLPTFVFHRRLYLTLSYIKPLHGITSTRYKWFKMILCSSSSFIALLICWGTPYHRERPSGVLANVNIPDCSSQYTISIWLPPLENNTYALAIVIQHSIKILRGNTDLCATLL